MTKRETNEKGATLESYEQIRNTSPLVSEEVRRQWIEADQRERMLRYEYRKLEENEDLTPDAKARRAGKEPPKDKSEQAKKRLESARRERDILRKALEDAQADYARLLAERRAELYADVLEARQAIAREAAEGARKALAAFDR